MVLNGGWTGIVWINLVQYRDRWRVVVKTITDLSIPDKTGNFLTCLATIGSSRWTLLHGIIQLIGTNKFPQQRT